MSNVLDSINKDNTRFTIFENDQVLTADQLNDLFNYLDVQSRLTRTKAIGVGIISGLEIGSLDNGHIVVSQGAAITTDGDLLNFETDQEFDQFDVFEDQNAKYGYFRLNADQPLALYELRDSRISGTIPGKDLTTFGEVTGGVISDFVGILYLETYTNDPDLCTGTDCDNKGAISEKNLKVLLIHKNNMRLLLQSMPATNTDYFSLEDIAIPRVVVSTAIDTYAELNASFTNALIIKDDIKAKLSKAYQVCKPIVEGEFANGDPTNEWNTLIDKHFSLSPSIYVQYIYDFARDIGYAYNEMRETLFAEDVLTDPDVDLFPKHVLMGLVRAASINTSVGPIASPVTAVDLTRLNITTGRAQLLSNTTSRAQLLSSTIRFNIGTLIRRFNPVRIDVEYRHHFFYSPVINSNANIAEQTRFCFMRIHAMITNFKIPVSSEVQSVAQGLKVTPGMYEDKPVGQRSIPFYYSYNRSLPLNLYWNFEANVRRKEDRILSYSAASYSNNQVTLNPLQYNILPYDFFRVEGHIGFTLSETEAALNKLILDNNLPINIQSVQVEKLADTIPLKPWFFPHLHLYEKSLRTTFVERLDKADLANDELKAVVSTIPVTEFKTARQSVIDNNKDVSDPAFNPVQFRASVANVITAAANVKAQTKQFAFSNSATPHDFISNTDILQKTDLLSNIYQQQLIKKKEGLMLGNFLRQNPGLEHTGGVVRGGTFVLVYTSADKKVVADFMLPYASVDKDVVPDPPIFKPIPMPNTPIIKFPLDTLFERIPNYKLDLTNTIASYAKLDDIDTRVNAKVNDKFVDVESKFDLKLAVTSTKLDSFNSQFNSFDERLKNNSTLFNNVFESGIKTRTLNTKDFVVGDVDLTAQVEDFQRRQVDLEGMAADDPGRAEKEKEFIRTTDALAKQIDKAGVTNDASNALIIKGLLADMNSGTTLVQNQELRGQASEVANTVNRVNLKLKTNR
ncbi:hypothetical protein IM792_19300 [Mucilaginibacter sp. JRF]|uniref:hypothetical protein n=1 Tax=Mucilaginibacter sp. JRF TaxID=2780088 RepID=UPI00187F5414|nr:hypothetical protein [Mucilaginibacter sp. JRF]MBE9586604.1 hypothetical protein [Mucilaginibacter sp. JRF]